SEGDDLKGAEAVYLASPYVASAYPAVSAYSAVPAVSTYSAYGAVPAVSTYSAYGAVPAVSTYSAYGAVPAVGYSGYGYAASPYAYVY
ncbi:pupal cuticle protein G1A-like, partial [Frankliniella occidentalis]|uniref:Pupal cuticle protein G1A-like n=1 Tax=Frankliniella occidentalis TaxID=133901 RepID=A0A9C6X467_FRAOC